MTIWHRFGRQLREPSGWAGRLTGHFMRLVNRAPNRLAVAALDLTPDAHVLELGFGPGEAIAALVDRLPDGVIEGIDRSAAMLAQASLRNRAAVQAGRVRLRLGDFASLPYADASFDAVLAINIALIYCLAF